MNKSFNFSRTTTSDSGEAVADLGRHFCQCGVARGRLFMAFMFAEQVHGFVAPRFMTTVFSASILLALLSWGL
jgi:hypothetical protein